MSKTTTKRDLFTALLTYIPADRTDLTEFVNHEIDLLAKKNAKTTGPKLNAKTDLLADVMRGEPAHTVSELQAMDATLRGMSNQEVTGLLRRMMSAGLVVKTTAGRKSYFQLADVA